MNTKQQNKNYIGHILAFFTIIVWGSTFIASKYLLDELSPTQIMFLRFIIAYIVLLIIKPKFAKLHLKDELGFLLLGIFGGTLYFFTENTALLYTLTSNVSIIVAAAPIITALLAHYFTKDEKIHKNVIYGFIVAFLGVVLVVFNGTVILKLNPLGDFLSLSAALCWAIYSIILKKFLDKYDSIILTRKIMFYGFITCLPFIITSQSAINFDYLLKPLPLICILFLGVIGSGICYVTWNIATKKLGIVTTNNYIYINPFVTMVAASLLLNENISVMGVVGAVLIISGVFISNKKQ